MLEFLIAFGILTVYTVVCLIVLSCLIKALERKGVKKERVDEIVGLTGLFLLILGLSAVWVNR